LLLGLLALTGLVFLALFAYRWTHAPTLRDTLHRITAPARANVPKAGPPRSPMIVPPGAGEEKKTEPVKETKIVPAEPAKTPVQPVEVIEPKPTKPAVAATPVPAKPAPAMPDVLPPKLTASKGSVCPRLDVYFAPSKTSFSDKDLAEIDTLASCLKEHPNATVRVEGRTDAKETHSEAVPLTQLRARALADELEKRGVNESQLKPMNGPQQCISNTPYCVHQNRGVTAIVQ